MRKYILFYLAEILIIGLGVAFYYFVFPFSDIYFDPEKGIGFYPNENKKYLVALGALYTLIAPFIHYTAYKRKEPTKIEVVLDGVKRRTLDKKTKQILLIFLLKFLFIPLMLMGTIHFGLNSYHHFFRDQIDLLPIRETTSSLDWINNILFPIFLDVTMFVAFFIYTLGYIIDSKALGTKIKSVEPTLFGWLVTIICYLPFYVFIYYLIPNASQHLAFYKNVEITVFVRIILMLIISFKIWTILTLGLKSANLTNRGIVTAGPYALIRHPHYLAKLSVWWIGLIPSALEHWWLIGPMLFWTMVYYLRAKTEENHLAQDENYRTYRKKVKWMFVPKII